MLRYILFATALFIFSSYASAAWQQASSKHFVIYSNQKAQHVEKFANRLEKLHAALSAWFGTKDTPVSPLNRVTVYALKNRSKLKKLYGEDNNRYIGGFYISRAGGSSAFIPKVKPYGMTPSESEVVLFHEYVHHFLASLTGISYPLWVSEGAAEFFANIRFEKNGDIGVGATAHQRGYEIFNSKAVPIEHLLNSKAYLDNKTKKYDSFYGRSWLLFHMLTASKNRKQQLDDYLQLWNAGNSELESAKIVFGDLAALDKEIDNYAKSRRFSLFTVSKSNLTIGEVAVRKLTESEAKLMPIRIQIARGLETDEAEQLLPEVNKLNALYPDQPHILLARAQLEANIKNYGNAITTTESILAINRNHLEALIVKGLAQAAIAMKNNNEESWLDVRKTFVTANRLDKAHPLPLYYFYRSYLDLGITPHNNAITALKRAFNFAPYDTEIRFALAQQFANEENNASAIALLKPIANDFHNKKLAKAATLMIENLKPLKHHRVVN